MIVIPLKGASRVIGFIQGKSVIRSPCACGDTEEVLLARASGRVFRLDVGRAEEIIRTYIRNQEQLANVGAVEPLALTGHFSGRLTWGRVSDPIGRFERPTSKAPGFAGGYLLQLVTIRMNETLAGRPENGAYTNQ